MEPHINNPKMKLSTTSWDASAPQALTLDPGPASELGGKVVFITVQDMGEATRLSTDYLQADAKLAILDVSDWALHILSPERDPAPSEPVPCASWVEAVETAIGYLGPIDLWLDTRAVSFPPVSRVGRLR